MVTQEFLHILIGRPGAHIFHARADGESDKKVGRDSLALASERIRDSNLSFLDFSREEKVFESGPPLHACL